MTSRGALSRRQVLVAGAGFVLAACADSKPSASVVGLGQQGGSSTTELPSLASLPDSQISVVQRFPTSPLFVPGNVRLAVSLAAGSGLINNVPDTLRGEIVDSNDKRVSAVTVAARRQGITTPYFAVRAAIDTPGTYTLRLDVGGKAEAAFQVFDPAKVSMPHVGAKLPAFDTPTTTDHRGVEPYCTLTPNACPFHSLTLTDALKAATPVVYMVGTPAHCSTGACAPGLQFLMKAPEVDSKKLTVVHAEVYSDALGTQLAPAVQALGVDYEPIIYLVDKTGTIVDHLDGVWDQSEVDEVLTTLAA